MGYEAQVVERFNHHAGPHGIRIDLFGLADVEAIADDHTLYVQATPAARLQDHVRKCLDERRLHRLIACPTRVFEIWSWYQPRKRARWTLRRYRAVVDAGEIVFVGVGESMPSPLNVVAGGAR
jgi:hypothetical protein